METEIIQQTAVTTKKQLPDKKEAQEVRNIKMRSVFVFLLIALVWLCLLAYSTAERYPTRVEIGNNGYDSQISASEIDFGKLEKGGSCIRFISVKNNGGHEMYINIMNVGNIRKIIREDRNSFILGPGEVKKIELSISVPADANSKEYRGTIIILKIPKIL